jgi:hypothetical protein
LRTASDEVDGHCLALTLLGGFLTDVCDGDVRYRTEVLVRLAHDVRQGAHARKVVESYQARFGEGPELSVFRMLGTHPLVREYFGEQLRSQQTDAWEECNRRLFHYYRRLAPQLPNNFRDMEPLFLAVICGCNAGLFREALHEVYIPRIQRGDSSFAWR